jgi:tetratricopeptide (TPR) repeat protein
MALKHRHEPQSPESIQAWRELSQLTVRARYTNMRDAATDTLRQAAAADPEGFFTPAYPLWIGDNFEQEGRFEEAAEEFAGVARQYGDRAVPFAVARIGGLALRRQAESLVRLGRWDDAAAALNAASRYAGGPSGDDLHYELGSIAERAGRRDEALASYRKATGRGNREGSEWSSGELAFRAAARLERPGRYERDPETLAHALAGALLRKDEAALRDLASPTHFTIAFGGCEQEFIEYDRVAPILLRALAESKVKLDPERLTGSGEKRYLETDGWNWGAAPFTGTVWFLLTRHPEGWTWSSVVFPQISEEVQALIPPPPRMENQPLDLNIKAPWASGLSFRAGGLDRFLESLIPIFGLGIVVADSSSPCGYGLGGYYYNSITSHVGLDAFAIDFTRHKGSGADGQFALAVELGLVTKVKSNVTSGNSSAANRVEVAHWSLSEPLSCGGPPPRYVSKYLHLRGPGLILVSELMGVGQGTRLGRMDDTGNSALPHLHFSIHDEKDGKKSVRPTPMDGQSLNDSDKGRCVGSTNVPIP